MNKESQEWEKVIQAYRSGNERAFDQMIVKAYQRDHEPRLLSLTKSKDDAWLVYVEAMLKFRDKFVIGIAPLPKNPNGYLNRMERNIWVDICRKRNQKKQIKFVEIENHQLTAMFAQVGQSGPDDYYDEEQKEEQYLNALEKAIGKMCDKCKEIIEKNIFQNIKLKTLKIEMNYTGSYQAIVEKKKRCIKKLTRIFFLELEQNIKE